MSLTTDVLALEAYLTKKNVTSLFTQSGFNVTAKSSPVGMLTKMVKKTAISAAMSDLESNPLVQMGIDTLNQIVTTVVQQVVTDAMSKINFSPLENAVQSFMQLMASVSTFQSEVAMELARNSGRDLVANLNKKTALIKVIQADLVSLHNACNLIANSGNFMDQYVKDLIQAYNILLGAEATFGIVADKLNSGNPTFLQARYTAGISQLKQAQALILPNRHADVSSITAITSLIETTIRRPTNQQALAAALIIPGISARIGDNMITYISLTFDINLKLETFMTVLSDWITSFTKAPGIYQVAIDHLASGMKQLTSLTDDMSSTLFFPTGGAPNLNPSSPAFGMNVSAQATLWGIRLQGIIQWMKMNPGAGAAQVDKTANSVQAYTKAITAISEFDSISFAGGSLLIAAGKESVESALTGAQASQSSLEYLVKLLFKVNTLLISKTSKASVTSLFRPVDNMFRASQQNVDRIIAAIQPFLATGSTLPGPAAQVLGQAFGVAQKYGLDRVAGIISIGDVKNLFGINAQNATYAGAALLGLNNIAVAVKSNPDATDAQINQIDDLRNVVNADKTAKGIEANRSYEDNSDAAQDKLKAKNKADRDTMKPALEAAIELDSSGGQSPVGAATSALSSVIPGFNSFGSMLS